MALGQNVYPAFLLNRKYAIGDIAEYSDLSPWEKVTVIGLRNDNIVLVEFEDGCQLEVHEEDLVNYGTHLKDDYAPENAEKYLG